MSGRYALSLLLLASACTSVPVLREFEARREAGQLLSRADERVQAGDYAGAEEAYRRVLTEQSGAPAGERALLGLARLSTLPGNPRRDYEQAQQHFERFLQEYPQSGWTGEARAWQEVLATLRADQAAVRQARQEIERLRQEVQTVGEAAMRRVRGELERLREEAQRARDEARASALDREQLRLMEKEVGRQRRELADARREIEQLRREAQRAWEDAEAMRASLERLKRLEMELERRR